MRLLIIEDEPDLLRRLAKTLRAESYAVDTAADGELITRLSSDPLLLGDFLFAICKPQADQQSIDDESFAEGLAGDSIDDACNALVDALVAYFPESRRRLLRKAVDKQMLIETRGLAAIERRLDDPALKR